LVRSDRRQPSGGWAGFWPADSNPATDPRPRRKRKIKPWGFVGFFPHKLEEILSEAGFDPEGVVRTWRDRGWLRLTQGSGVGRTRLRVKIGNRCSYVVAVTHAAVVAAGAG
jgi:hypothetical protein